MAKRKKLSKSQSKSAWSKGSRVSTRNLLATPLRGGFRL